VISVGTEKLYMDLEEVNVNLINKLYYARDVAREEFIEQQTAINKKTLK
jgi:hypothetical protein